VIEDQVRHGSAKWICLFVLVAFCLSPSVAFAWPSPCSARDLTAQLSATDPAYKEAMSFSALLKNHGVAVGCVLSSKMDNMFTPEEGSALYRTDVGDFEVLFLPQPQDWTALKIIGKKKTRAVMNKVEHSSCSPPEDYYEYSFAGFPKPWSANDFESDRPVHFIKHGNALLVVFQDETATRLTQLLGE
jgi:hypothetical protein